MTLVELLAWDKKESLEVYQEKLKILHRLEKQLGKLYENLYDAEDSMRCFNESEYTDQRYLKYKKKKEDTLVKIEKIKMAIKEI